MIGKVLGHYQVIEKIGSGGMGDVYRGRDDRLGRDVALKVLRDSLAGDPDRTRRFEQEGRAAAALSHPNIVAVYDVGVQDGIPYIVSELLEGQTLRERMRSGPMSVRQVADYGVQIAEGLKSAHEKRIVHRDLKPENLFITRDNHVKILDFGIAKLTGRDIAPAVSPESMVHMDTQTKVGSVLGTVGYMSPEQLRGRPVDHRSDIFSCGSILYEMLTGKRAFSGESEADTMMAVLSEDPPDMSLTRQSIPPAFDQIVHHCLEKEPEQRFQSAQDLAFALSTVSGSSTAKIPAVRAPWERLRKMAPWIVSAAMLAVAGVFVGTHLRGDPSPEYKRLTFERGTIYSARYSPDGRTVLYGASWNGRPLELFSTVEDSSLARPMGLNTAFLLALSKSNELAVAMNWIHAARRELANGVLARAPLAGGTPREVMEDVRWADWSPDGELAVVHYAHSRSRLEFPIGNVLYETTGAISHIRFSPRGTQIAFMDHPAAWDDRGAVCVVNLDGQKRVLSAGWESEDGLAWDPQGNEVWFTAARSGFSNRALWAVDMSGREREVLAIPGGLTLHDISGQGHVLASVDAERLAMEWSGKSEREVRDLSWYDWSVAKDISADGQWVLFEEANAPTTPKQAVAIRKIDGSPPIRLGDGTVGSLSPDGKWAVSVSTGSPQHINLLPVGVGEAKQVAVPGLEHMEDGAAHFMPDGKHVVVNGYQAGGSARSFIVDLAGSEPPRAITPEGIYANLPSPDGKYLAGTETGSDSKFFHAITLYPVNGGSAIHLPASDPPYSILQWSRDSRSLLLYKGGEMPLTVYRVAIDNGKIEAVRQLTPADRTGVVSIAPVVARQDGSEFAYSYYQTLSVLYEISGLH